MVSEHKIKFLRTERATSGRKTKILLNSNMTERRLPESNALINSVIAPINHSN